MGELIDLAQLVGAAEIAQRLQIKQPHLVHDWRRRYSDFPTPGLELTGILRWDWHEVQVWASQTNRIKAT